MMKQRLLSIIVVFVCFTSCSAKITGSLYENGTADLTVRASLEPRMATLMSALSRLNRASPAREQILDGPAIGQSMSSAPGVKSVSFHNIDPTTIEGTIGIERVDAFLTLPASQGGKGFIRYEQTGAGGRLRINVNRDLGPQIITRLSTDVKDYLSALMAPVATGEMLSKHEYLGLVNSIYGKPIADEIAAARVQASIDFPRPIAAIQGGLVSGTSKNRGEFSIPLVDLLVLETPLEYEVSWK